MIAPFALLLLILTRISFAQQTSALINQQLDQQTNLEIKNKPLPAALKEIANQTGVRIEPSANVYDLLPWGDQTSVAAVIKNQTLREGLDAIARKLGLQMVLKDNYVELQPMPALSRLGQRATVQELQALDLLSSTLLKLPSEQVKVSQLIDAVDQKLLELKSAFAVENRLGDRVPPDRMIAVPRNATMMDALEALSQQTSGTWYPWGKSIVILPKEEQVRKMLGKQISVRYDGVDVDQVLRELSARSGVEFTMEPGATQRVPREYRKVRLVLDNATIQQALESLAGFTGLGYVINESGVYIWNATYGFGAGGNQDPVVGMLQLDNGMQVLMRQSQVPADVREYMEYKTGKEYQKLRQQMKDENFKPATKPAATKPRNEDL
jgi:hypothetical protein